MAPTVTRLILSLALVIATPTLFFVALFVGFEILDDWLYSGAWPNEELFFVLAAMGVEALPCPACGYNLSGLRKNK